MFRSGIAILAGLWVSSAIAEDAPGLDQTWEYLEGAFAEDQSRNVQETYDFFPSVSFDKNTCKMTFQVTSGSKVLGSKTLSMQDLDPSLVVIGDYIVDEVTLMCREKKQCVTNAFSNGETHHVTSITMALDDAERNAKAFVHLIKLCGGKEELF